MSDDLCLVADRFDFIVIDSPNQISPIMENAIFPADVFIVPFESTKAVKVESTASTMDLKATTTRKF